jgi:hypothetical protein
MHYYSGEFLIKYMKRKAHLIESLTGIPEEFYLTTEDINALEDMQVDFPYLPDNFYCPFCVVWDDDCNQCPYAKRHGVCGENGSTFQTICNALEAEGASFKNLSANIYNIMMEESAND